MKYKFFFLAIFPIFVLSSCKNTSENKTVVSPNDCTEYACPMHPDHTSNVAAKCPECNMEMDSVKRGSGKDSTLVH